MILATTIMVLVLCPIFEETRMETIIMLVLVGNRTLSNQDQERAAVIPMAVPAMQQILLQITNHPQNTQFLVKCCQIYHQEQEQATTTAVIITATMADNQGQILKFQ